MSLREEFVRLARTKAMSLSALCQRFSISRTTGYKWLNRYRAEGCAGLAERSRRPRGSPRRTPEDVETEVLRLRAAHPAWGGRKIARRLADLGLSAPPAASTITGILRRHGVVLGLHGGGSSAFKRFEHPTPNALWQMDFKGHVAMKIGRLHPLTVLDDHSRFSIVLAACPDQRTATVKAALTAAMRRYGLPDTLITDNGSPWGNGPGQPFTPLGVFLIEQGVRIAHSRPYHPQTLGKDERFHRSLKAEALSGPPFMDLAEAAAQLNRWRDIYNLERPHEALGLATPASRYQPSPRAFIERVAPFDYGPGAQLRRVAQGGRINFLGRLARVPKAFAGHTIALKPHREDGVFTAWFRHQPIAQIDITKAKKL